MMMWMRRWVVTVGGIGVIAAMVVSPSFADQGHGQKGHGGHGQEDQHDHGGHYLKHLLKHAKEIGLTLEQIRKLKSLQLDFKRTEARLEADAKVAKLELGALVDDEQVDLNAIQAKVEQLKKAEAACLFAEIKAKHHAAALLSPDQREKERAAHEHMMSGGQHGAGGGGMGSGGMMGGRGGMGGMMGGMGGGMTGGSAHGQGSGDHGSGGSSGGQEHQH